MTKSIDLKNKQNLWNFWKQLNKSDFDQSINIIKDHYSENTQFNAFHPVNLLLGTDNLINGYWEPLKKAAPNIKREVDILCAGQYRKKEWVSSIGYMTGSFIKNWLGIPTHGKDISIRYGEFCALQNGKIIETYIMLDVLDVLEKIGHRALPPSLSGEEGTIPGPTTNDGILLFETNDDRSQVNIDLVNAMLDGLLAYDQINLKSMKQHKYWHPEKMVWYGPNGIGTTRGLQGFEDYHQQPFLNAFPNRIGDNHISQFGDDNYVANTGWPSISATHQGSYLGVPATGKQITMRVMDWWRCEDNWLVENWVLIDLPDLFLQLGIDLLGNLPI